MFDKYGRIFAYACILDKNKSFIMLNEQMLKDGFAYLLTIPPNSKHIFLHFQSARLAN